MVAQPKGILWKESFVEGKGRGGDDFPAQPRRIPGSSAHVREIKGIPVDRRDFPRGKGYSAAEKLGNQLLSPKFG
jgi:hypothetical protein